MAEEYYISKKYHEISVLAKETVKRVSKNGDEWTKYLTTAARLYRYPFEDQLLIYAQRPDATACAVMETWNDKMFCWVNRGAKGIALFDRESRRPRLRYVFDVSDVHKSRRMGKDPYLWEIREEHKDAVLAQLEKTYGAADSSNSFEGRLIEIAERITEDYYKELLTDLSCSKEGSFLEELDEMSMGMRLRETLFSSAAYTLLSRCGADMDLWKDRLNFDYISGFNTAKALSVIGNATTDMCRPLLIEIRKTVAAYDRRTARNKAEEKADRAHEEPEKNPEKALANTPELYYNALKHESENKPQTETVTNHTEIEMEGVAHGTDIREERGLSDTQPDTRQRTGGTADQVRADERELSEGTPEGHLQRAADDGRTESALSKDTETGRGKNGLPDRADGESWGSGRGAEGVRPDEMGGRDEQHTALSGGNRAGGAGLQPLNNRIQQNIETEKPDSEEHALSGSFLENLQSAEKNMEFQKQILCFDEFLIHKRPEIAGYFAMEQDAGLQTDYLKNSFRMEEFTEFNIGESRAGYFADEEGLIMWKGRYFTREAEARISWEEARFFVNSYIEDGVYLSAGEKAEQIDTDGMYRQLDLFSMFTEQADRIAMKQAEQNIIPAMKTSPEPPEDKSMQTKIGHDTGVSCKNAIEKAIAENFDGYRLPKGTAENVIKEYGIEQVSRILANSVMHRSQEGRFSPENKEWAESVESHAVYKDMVIASHPAVLNGFINQTRRHIGREKLAAQTEAGQDTSGHNVQKPEYKTGDTVTIEGTEFIIEKISDREVQLRDPKLLYPIFRAESRENFERLLAEETGNIPPEPNRKSPVKQRKPEIDKSNATNFHITEDSAGNDAAKAGTGFSPKEKFKRNIEAVHTLKKIEGENRTATPKEQKILARYVGWGGLADAFDKSKSAWAGEYQELKNLLSDTEYHSARESTLNAHYTSPIIIRSIYEALENMGFEKGNILEPAMGIGNFYGCLPEKMQDSSLYGVELDGITGRIARQLYPKADIKISGFEKTDYPDDFFDVAVGNVPFGQYKVADRKYDRHNFLIHDYFLAKTLDKVRPGGVIAFITSKGTMDKKSPEVRRYLVQRAELLGAVRLPNTAFKENAGTEVTSDILFLKKRDRRMDLEPDWVHLSEDENGIAMNSYFVQHPEMIAGKMEMVSGPYGMESACLPDFTKSFEEQLREAVSRIDGKIEEAELDGLDNELPRQTIPADPEVKNYSYTLVDGEVYYRENSVMKPVDMKDSLLERIKGMVGIRDCTYGFIRVQLEEYPDYVIKNKQTELNELYDTFSKKYGLINSQTNKRAFRQDSSYCLLCSLEKMDEEGKFIGKADMFTKRTIKKAEVVTSVDTAAEALAVSLSEKARVDLGYMAELSGKDIDMIKGELTGVIFQNPVTDKWETADEYLSGNVRDKLETAIIYAENRPEYAINVQALTRVQPKELDAGEIEVRIGATWVKPEYLEDFMRDIFQTPQHLFDQNIVGVQFSDVTGQWRVKGKNADYGNTLVNMTYGTSCRNAYQILEDSLNLKDSRVYETIKEDGKEKRVLNKKETTLAAQKQDTIRQAFRDWIFRDPDRRQDLVAKYNKLFNSTRPREYNGEHLKFPGMTPDIELKPHQKNAVAHVLYGSNTLLAHCVGAGKTFEMTAAAMESRRLGLCQKSLFVVPNHLTEQWASDFLRLYPGANILAATKKDFEPANRKKFCSRIATGDFDAVIIGHSQFERIPLSIERQETMIQRQMNEIELAIEQAKADNGENYTVKQMEKTRKSLLARLEKLNDTSRKDNVVTFEQLGVDRLFVDESHFYKNLFLYTKMRNVAGIAQAEAQKSSDMFAKCQYLDEITGGKGVTFATGTPISNSMTELYTNMRYLQYGTLQKLGLGHFDSWASSFGETQTAIELSPEGTGYRAKTRFAKFFNLPELIALFKESADIQTPDMLKLPVPEAEYENVVLKPSEYQQDMISSLADRAEAVRNRLVEPHQDNMLKITNDGRKLALDQRLINDMLPDSENSKAAVCAGKAFEIWEQTKEQKSTQLIFCDLSTPKGDGTFNVYEDIKNKLTQKGVPPEEIAFIHQANTETRKAELFGKVRSGQVRFLLGSTQKMGAGTNVQDRLIALHHLDVPWRPSDIEQQEGRILRQGNRNDKVKIFRYITENTFDSYSWQLIENKQKFIGQIMTSKSPVRSCEDVDEAALTYAEVKALATGNPYIKEKMELDVQVSKLKLMKASYTSQKYRLEDNIAKHYPQQTAILKEMISGMRADIRTAETNLPSGREQFFMKVGDKFYTDKKEAGTALVEMCREMKTASVSAVAGEYAGFKMEASFDSFNHKFVMKLKGKLSHTLEIGSDPLGNITRINHALESMPKQLAEAQTKLQTVERQLETAKAEVTKPFAQEAELAEKLERLSALNALLNMDEKGDDVLGIEEGPEEENESLETSGHDVQKPGQEKDDSEKQEREEKTAETPIPYPIETVKQGPAKENGNPQELKPSAAIAGQPVQKISLKEKLETLQAKIAGGDAEKFIPQKAKDKAEIL